MGTITDSTNQASGMSVLALSWVSACGKRAAFLQKWRHLASREKIVYQARLGTDRR
jgi:hypothetical protein